MFYCFALCPFFHAVAYIPVSEQFFALQPTTAIIFLHCRQQPGKVLQFQFMRLFRAVALNADQTTVRKTIGVVAYTVEKWSAQLATTRGRQRYFKNVTALHVITQRHVLRAITFSSDNGSNLDRAITLRRNNGSCVPKAKTFRNDKFAMLL